MNASPPTVVITYLDMADPAQHRPAGTLPAGMELQRESAADAAAVASLMYRRVGGPWEWTDRKDWSVADWRVEIDRDDVEVWTARERGEVVGYFELIRRGDAVAIQYFGLVPEHIGRGLGGPLLSAAIRRCWELGPRCVQLNTCTLDHPRALPNYLARGFRIAVTATRAPAA